MFDNDTRILQRNIAHQIIVSRGISLFLIIKDENGLWEIRYLMLYEKASLRENCPNMEFFLVRIFLYSCIYSVNLRIQSENRKIRIRKNSVLGHFSRRASLHDFQLLPYSAS